MLISLVSFVTEKNPSSAATTVTPKAPFFLFSQILRVLDYYYFFVSVYHLIVSAWICTLCIIDDSYERPGLTVNVFSNKREELPNHDGMILFLNIKVLFGFCFRCFCLKEDIKKNNFFHLSVDEMLWWWEQSKCCL